MIVLRIFFHFQVIQGFPEEQYEAKIYVLQRISLYSGNCRSGLRHGTDGTGKFRDLHGRCAGIPSASMDLPKLSRVLLWDGGICGAGDFADYFIRRHEKRKTELSVFLCYGSFLWARPRSGNGHHRTAALRRSGRLAWYAGGLLLCAIGISFLFHTYISPEAYELFVKEISAKFGWSIPQVKTIYDCCSCLLGIILSFLLFGFGHFEGVKLGTVFCALINGWLIGQINKILDRLIQWKDALPLRKWFG